MEGQSAFVRATTHAVGQQIQSLSRLEQFFLESNREESVCSLSHSFGRWPAHGIRHKGLGSRRGSDDAMASSDQDRRKAKVNQI